MTSMGAPVAKNPSTAFAVTGIHGFSRSHISSLQRLAQTGVPVRLIACAAVARDRDEDYAAALEAAGVILPPDFERLLAMRDRYDVLTLPVGIAMHEPMAVKALQAGLAVYLEKPVAATVREVEHLAAVERASPGPLFIGFQDCFQPSTWALKRLLCDGHLGRLRRMAVIAAWPRPASYYRRNNWAGRLRDEDSRFVLDSPLNNACAHFMNLALFLSGRRPGVSAHPVQVEAELYRANPIESCDTVALKVSTDEDVSILYLATHACPSRVGPRFRIECDRGTVWHDRTHGIADPWTLCHADGRKERIEIGSSWVDPFAMVARRLAGDCAAPVCTLAMAAPHTLVVDGAHRACPIESIPGDSVLVQPVAHGDTLNHIRGIADVFERCFVESDLPSACCRETWTTHAGTARIRGPIAAAEEESPQ